MTFKRWSEVNPKVKQILSPDLGIRSWGDLSTDNKNTILRILINKRWVSADEPTWRAVFQFFENNKAGGYCNHLLQHGGPHCHPNTDIIKQCCFDNARMDFEHILIREHQEVFYELLTYYISTLDSDNVERFKSIFNDISNQFNLNILIGDESLILKQEEIISELLTKPALSSISDKKWDEVNRDLNDSVQEYLKNTPEGYSSSITLSVSSLQAFLQILVNGEIGKGDIGPLITKAQETGLIPKDAFSSRIFKDLESILMAERQIKGSSHPKTEYATEKHARLVLNLTLLFIQHST